MATSQNRQIEPNPELARWFEKIDKQPSGCWNWTGTRGGLNGGRPQFRVNGRRVAAHRYSYETFVGPIPEGRVLHPHCGNPVCVAPTHMDLNIVERTHCRNGHDLSIERNRRFWGRYLKCAECPRERRRTRREKGVAK